MTRKKLKPDFLQQQKDYIEAGCWCDVCKRNFTPYRAYADISAYGLYHQWPAYVHKHLSQRLKTIFLEAWMKQKLEREL